MCCNTKKSTEITFFISNIKHVLVSQWCQDLPFWVSLVEQIKVAIWKLSFVLSLVGVKLARWCRFFPEGASFSSISIFVQGRVKQHLASSIFLLSPCWLTTRTKWVISHVENTSSDLLLICRHRTTTHPSTQGQPQEALSIFSCLQFTYIVWASNFKEQNLPIHCQ